MTFAVLAVAVVMSAAAHAQWLTYPTAGIPRTADGKPKMDAPAPRGLDGKPDLSGMWGAEKTRPCPPDGCDDMQISEQFLNIGWRVPGGLPYQPWAAAIVKKRTAELRKDDPQSYCLPDRHRPHAHDAAATGKSCRRRDCSSSSTSATRPIARSSPTAGRCRSIRIHPGWGTRPGRWEGDTLVVRTTGFRDGLWLDAAGSPLTDAGTVTERFRRVNFGKLEIQLTVDDPKAYTKPWTTTLNQFIFADTELLDYICLENERDVEHFSVK